MQQPYEIAKVVECIEAIRMMNSSLHTSYESSELVTGPISCYSLFFLIASDSSLNLTLKFSLTSALRSSPNETPELSVGE